MTEVFNSLESFRRAFLSDIPTHNSGFPQYNIVQVSDYDYTIEMAVAGYNKNELDVSVDNETLTIVGAKEDTERKYVYRGLAARNFTRKFTLADTVVVKGVSLNDGILTVDLHRVVPEERRPRKLEINQK